MKSSRLKGVFADRPLDPGSKQQKRKAVQAAAESILELYQVLMEIVDDHNNRPHPALRRRPILAQAGVKPTPREAYLWGLKNITGLRRPPVSDEDIYRMLLSVNHATLSNGTLRYRNRIYDPANGAATAICEHSRRRATRIMIRIDKSAPFELFIPGKRGDWAHFRISEGAAEELSGVTIDEEQALAPVAKFLHATAEHEARVVRVTKDASHSKTKGRGRSTPVALDRKAQYAAAAQETAEMKAVLTGKQHTPVGKISKEPPATERWKDYAEQERLRAVEATRKRQGLL